LTGRDLIDEQIAYYRARAAEYDATSTPQGDPHAAHGAATHAALRAFNPRGRVLELAAGTGQWSRRLAEVADELVVSDSSPEMLQLARARVGDPPNVAYELRDAFDLEPTHDFDVVMFGYFLSHVPPDRFDAFWSALEGVLRPDGRVFFVDEGRHFLWREDWIDEPAGIVRRQLGNGTVHRAVKVLWSPSELESRLRRLGWAASVRGEGPFYWGSAAR
jgi:demethylmenaquinone methyltransferase/2-methoxy-6-polyprenyl-1,4-benzoquinol methylase